MATRDNYNTGRGGVIDTGIDMVFAGLSWGKERTCSVTELRSQPP